MFLSAVDFASSSRVHNCREREDSFCSSREASLIATDGDGEGDDDDDDDNVHNGGLSE